MNGVVHNCVRGNGSKDSGDSGRYHNMLQTTRSDEDILLDVFKYIDNIMSMIRPRKLVYFAVDGVAPRAKMNQQRSRRFRSARERTEEHKRRLAEDPMYVAVDSEPFDSNCISPGTAFMQKLTEGLNYYVNDRISTNSQWSSIQVVLSGAEAPGEGEHKIMEYIRAVKIAGKMAPNTRHCLYGLDADLIMLALVSHEPHFFLLREKVDFGSWRKKGGPRIATHLDTITFGEFELLSVGILREYLALDLGSLGNSSLPFFDIERVVDDFVFMLMLVGNDFLPHLPTVEIADGMVVAMMHLYKNLLPRWQGYLTESGRIIPDRVELFVAKLSLLEIPAMKRKEKERDRSFRHGGGSKALFTGTDELSALWGFVESFSSDSHFDVESEIEKCRKVTHSNQHIQKKQKYYQKKFDAPFGEDIDANLDCLTSSYIEGIVWTLKYYFEGCQSWRWYYPYHYAPFPSDLVSIAERVSPDKITFKPDNPFLPLQQLMSVLPPDSSECIPTPYRKLMKSALSPIADFYPEDFEVDLNGKKNDWEGVVLLPFVDEERLLEAMSSISQTELTAAEKRRNTLGLSSVLERGEGNFTKEVESPFPTHLGAFISCAKETLLKLPEVTRGTSFPPKWVMGTHAAGSASWVSDLPTFHPVPHAGKLDKVNLNLFGYPSKHESLVLTLGSWKVKSRDFIFFDELDNSSRSGELGQQSFSVPQSIDELVHLYGIAIGSQVWIHFPWRDGAIVEAIMDESRTIRRASPPRDQTCDETKTNRGAFETQANIIAASLMEKGGIDIDKPKVLVEVLPNRMPSNSLHGNTEPIPILLPVVTVLSESMARKEPNVGASSRLDNSQDFSVGQKVLFVGRGPFFGSLCEVKEIQGTGNVRVLFNHMKESAREIAFGYDVVEKWLSQRWKPLLNVASRCSLPVGVANAFLGSVRVRLENGKNEIDLGLGIKYASRGLHIPGYAKVNEYGSYFFSEKAITLLCRFKEAFPQLFKVMDTLMHSTRGTKGAPVYEPSQLFPKAKEPTEAVKAVASWVSATEVATQPLVPSSSFVLHRDAVFDLEKNSKIARILQEELTRQLTNGGKSGTLWTVSQPQLRAGNESLAWEKDPTMKNPQCLDPIMADGRTLRLGDRVVNRLAYTGMPFGLRGTVVGLHNQNVTTDMHASSSGGRRRQHKNVNIEPTEPSPCMVEVVFDEEFLGGGDLNGLCNAQKGKAVPASSLYTIRPDRVNDYYSKNYNRISKIVNTKPSNWADNFRRGRAISVAAEASFRAAIESCSPASDASTNMYHMEIAKTEDRESKSSKYMQRGTRNESVSVKKQVVAKGSGDEPSMHHQLGLESSERLADANDAEYLTEKIKEALGISISSGLNLRNEGDTGISIISSPGQKIAETNSQPKAFPSEQKTPRRRGGRHRSRKVKATKCNDQQVSQASEIRIIQQLPETNLADSGNSVSDANISVRSLPEQNEDEFKSLWDKLKSTSLDH